LVVEVVELTTLVLGVVVDHHLLVDIVLLVVDQVQITKTHTLVV
jgi:hypothetical protein